jgi:hypothetical protein
MTGLLRARRERPRGCRAAEQRDEFAPFHCPMPPVLPTERIAHLAGACCAAGFQSRLCRLWVIFVRPTRFRRSRHVRIATESGQITDISECPLCADFVAKGVDGFREQ